jgi:hypothetical protein
MLRSPFKVNKRFGGTYASAFKVELAICFHASILLGLYFGPEDWGDMFLRNAGWLSTNYMALNHRRQYTS